MMRCHVLIKLLILISLVGQIVARSVRSLQDDRTSSCTSCVDRSSKIIHAFYHGNEDDPFWHPIVAAANQAGFNHRVTLKTTLYPSFDTTAMANDIRQAVRGGGVDAVIVSALSEEVREAVKEATAAGIAVFGVKGDHVDSTQSSSGNLGLAAMVGQDEYRAGQVAARRFLEAKDAVQTDPPSVGPILTAIATDNEGRSVPEFYIKVIFVVCGVIGMGIFAFAVPFGTNLFLVLGASRSDANQEDDNTVATFESGDLDDLEMNKASSPPVVLESTESSNLSG
jgi:ABC-type sugar transport system substrate-binding protein